MSHAHCPDAFRSPPRVAEFPTLPLLVSLLALIALALLYFLAAAAPLLEPLAAPLFTT